MYNIGYCSYQDPRLIPPDYWDEPNDRQTREDIEVWTLEIAAENGSVF